MHYHPHNPIQERVIIINNNKTYLVAHKVTFLQCLVGLITRSQRHQTPVSFHRYESWYEYCEHTVNNIWMTNPQMLYLLKCVQMYKCVLIWTWIYNWWHLCICFSFFFWLKLFLRLCVPIAQLNPPVSAVLFSRIWWHGQVCRLDN